MTTTTTTYRVEICRNNIWAGAGRFVRGSIVDCGAILGDDEAASEETYELLEDLLAEQLESDPKNWDCEVRVHRPDGTYTAALSIEE